MATINFYLDKPDKKGFAPIHLRINCNGSQVKISTGQKIDPKNFNKSKQKAIGLSVESREINHYWLSSRKHIVYSDIFELHPSLIRS
jgi:DNA (cytosine-5)-methyltransferase 1